MEMASVPTSKPPAIAQRIAPWRIAVSLFCLSFGSSLFALSVFKLLSFFIMPSLFFDLLFIGFPLGALIGVKYFRPDLRSVQKALVGLQVVMVGSMALCLMAKRFDYLRAHLFDIQLPWLMAQVATFVCFFLPFFAAYGLCEYLGYQVGRRHIVGRMRIVYALALFGAAAAYVFLKVSLPLMGMVPILAASFAGIALAGMAILPGRLRWLYWAELGILAAAALAPGVEPVFLSLYKGKGHQSTWDFIANRNCRSVFQKWGRYSLCEILEDPRDKCYYGFYNDLFQWEYKAKFGFAGPSLGAVPVLLSKPKQHLAIIGAGGGRQVRLAEKLGGRSVTAIELEPAVFDAVRSKHNLLNEFGGVYEAVGVKPILGEARSFLEKSSEKYDLIYLPSVGGYPQMMIEPGNMVRTYQAYRTMRDHLTPDGMIAIWYPYGLDTRGILTSEYVRTLRSLGLKTEAFRTDHEFLILGSANPVKELPTAEEMVGLLRLDASLGVDESVRAGLLPRPYEVEHDPDFTPITDQKPFLAGNVRYILSMSQILTLFGSAAAFVGLVGLGFWRGLGRGYDPRPSGRSFRAVAVLATLIGVNFLLMEHTLVLAFFRRIFVYDDALGMGVVGFLTLSGLGSLFESRATRPAILASALFCLSLFLLAGERFSAWGVFFAFAPVAMLTGVLFPMLFERMSQQPIAVFAFDAIGSAIGALTATFVPLVWGIDAIFTVSAAVFLATVAMDYWFHRPPPNAADASIPATP